MPHASTWAGADSRVANASSTASTTRLNTAGIALAAANLPSPLSMPPRSCASEAQSTQDSMIRTSAAVSPAWPSSPAKPGASRCTSHGAASSSSTVSPVTATAANQTTSPANACAGVSPPRASRRVNIGMNTAPTPRPAKSCLTKPGTRSARKNASAAGPAPSTVATATSRA